LYGVALLACPIGMGLMMWMMMRGKRGSSGDRSGGQEQVAALRAEIDQLKADRAGQRTPGG
ncbi:MAG: hypothetical protein ACREX8_15415, partial [Gammaproteobacteria bacterium]